MTPQEHLEKLKEIVQYPQRSEEWFSQRRDKLTSSDAGTCLDVNPYQKPVEVLLCKCGAPKKFTGNVATLHGQKYEDEAIELYCRAMGKRNHNFGLISFDAVGRENDPETNEKYPNGIPWLAGSTDGIAEDLYGREGLVVLEVKCPFRRKIVYGKCPEYYYPQVQLNMAILNIEKADYIEYKPSSNNQDIVLNIVRIQRNRKWFDQNYPILNSFWESVLYWRTKDITEHPDYPKYYKESPIPKPPMFLEDSDDDSD